MSKIYVYNPDLSKDQRVDDPVVDIYELLDTDLLNYGWLHTNLWPTNKFEILLAKIRAINPLVIEDNPKFWDSSVSGGYAIYNHAITELVQTEGLDY